MADDTTRAFLLDCFAMCTEVEQNAEAVGDYAFASTARTLAYRCGHRARDGFAPWMTEGSRRRGIATLLADLVRFQSEVPNRDGLTDERGLCVVESWYRVSRSLVEMVVAGFLHAEAGGEE